MRPIHWCGDQIVLNPRRRHELMINRTDANVKSHHSKTNRVNVGVSCLINP